MVIFRNILAVIVGWAVGSAVNMGLVQVGNAMYPVQGIDVNDMDAFASVISTLPAEHFIFPFLAHALGTLIGAVVAYFIAATHKTKFALVIGVLFFLGGIAVNYMLTGPIWFTALDLIVAYFPMAFIVAKIAGSLSKNR